jgi:hypothetical protein
MAVAEWQWLIGCGRMAVAEWQWLNGCGRMAVAEWQWLWLSILFNYDSFSDPFILKSSTIS